MSNNPKNLHKRALDLFKANRPKEALAIYRKLCRLNGNDAQAWHMTGAIAGMTGDYTTAISCCEKVIALNPRNHGPYLNLANVFMVTGNFQEAMQRFNQALQLKPGDTQTLTNMANLYAQQGQPESAENFLQRAIKANPEYPEAYNNLGNLYRDMARPEDAEKCFKKALSIKPGYVDALCNLGAVFSDQLNFTKAEGCYTRALQYAPEHLPALRNLGDLYQSTGEFDRAKSCYEQALKHSPSDIDTLTSLATLHERCGNMEGALALLAPLIESGQYSADSAITYAKLCRKQGKNDTGIQVLSGALGRPVNLNKAIDIHFSLGELYDHSGLYDQAFKYFKAGNDQDAARQPAVNQFANLERMGEFFSADRLKDLPRSTVKSELPIFIVGMPRTGTSLVEQILASHPLVSAGGEREDIFKLIASPGPVTGEDMQFPSSLESITQDSLNEMAARHLERISPLANGRLRFTDKTPLHGILLGFINQLLPKSRIIICHRNPFDTCLSIYFHRFNAFHGYAYQLDTLGTFFREYYKLMDHWINILDLEILSIQYEDLVRDPEKYIRSIIGFCGLDWDSNCLLFHENKRTVNTPSYDQVRKPMYTNSVDRWKHYQKHLGPLRTALDK